MINLKEVIPRIKFNLSKNIIKHEITWKDCDIPARLFFKIIDTGDLTILGTAPGKDLEKAWSDIIDEFADLKGDERIISVLKKS